MIQGESVLVTGGAGFIGSTLIARLLEHNRVRVFDTLDRDALSRTGLADHANLELVRGDVRDADAVARAVAGVDRVAHLASIAGVGTVLSHPVKTMQIAITGTMNVLEAAREAGNVKRVVTFSTSEVFGRHAFNVSEADDTPIGPFDEARWTYAVSKIASEHLVHGYGREHGMPVVTLRPFNVYGPGQIGEGAIHNFIRRALAGDPITVYNDGRQIRSWCYITDMVDATLAALELEDAVGHAFNVGNPAATITVLRLAELVQRLAGSTTPIAFERRDYPDVETRVPNIDRARRLLGYEPQVSLEAGIEQTLAWYRESAA